MTLTSMRILKLLFTICSLLFLHSLNLQAQPIPKTLVIGKKEVYEVGPSNALILDTLIMEDKATLHFSSKGQGILIVKTAIIGKNCLISSRGNTEQLGESGGSLSLTIRFDALGNLTIDASGEDGSMGRDGRSGTNGVPDRVEKTVLIDNKGNRRTIETIIPGTPATNGIAPTSGELGGNGGNISLTYGTSGFIINFNNSKSKHYIVIKNSAGKTGKAGRLAKHTKMKVRENNFDENDNEVKQPLEQATNGKTTLQQMQEPLVRAQ